MWGGSALDCPLSANEIVLLHAQFMSGTAQGNCNDGTIIAHAVAAGNQNFTSELIILNVTSAMDDSTVECSHDNGLTTAIVHSEAIRVTTGNSIIIIVTIYNHCLVPQWVIPNMHWPQ